MQRVDTLIYAGWIIPVEPANVIYEHHALAIKDDKIVGIVPSNEAVSHFAPSIIYRLPGHVLIPGLINTHTHAAMNLLRGYADDLPLQVWLEDYIWPVEQACVDTDFVKDGTKLAIAEMVRGGITCFQDMYFYPDVVGEVANQAGVRATLGLLAIDFPTTWANDIQEYIKKGHSVHQQFTDSPLITTAWAPHAPYTVSDNAFKLIKRAQDKLDIRMHMHIHETAQEVNQGIEQQGVRPLTRLHKLGLLDEKLMAVHMTQLNSSEIELLAERGVHILHCPESNMKLASGVCPVVKLSEAGINVALGTDGAASNDDLDLLGEMRTAALLGKVANKDASSLPAMQILEMATINGAKALGIAEATGSLVAGKSADITAIDLSEIETQPLYNPLSHLIYAVGRDKVTDVWVAGKHILKSRVLTTLDIHTIKAKTRIWRDKILSHKNAQALASKNEEKSDA